MFPQILKQLRSASLFLSGATASLFLSRAWENVEATRNAKEQAERALILAQEQAERDATLADIYTQNKEIQIKIEELKQSLKNQAFEQKEFIDSKLNEMVSNAKKIAELKNSSDIPEETQQQLNEHSKVIETCAEQVRKSLDGIDKEHFTSWLHDYMDFLNSLTLQQEQSFLNVLIFSALILTVFNLIFIYFSNEIIKYFKLDSKYPSLAYFLKLRTQLQRYYLIWNILILIALCSLGILINILSLYVN